MKPWVSVLIYFNFISSALALNPLSQICGPSLEPQRQENEPPTLEEALHEPKLLDQIVEAQGAQNTNQANGESPLQKLARAHKAAAVRLKALQQATALSPEEIALYQKISPSMPNVPPEIRAAVITYANLRLVKSPAAITILRETLTPYLRVCSEAEVTQISNALASVIRSLSPEEGPERTQCLLFGAHKSKCTDWAGHNPDLFPR